LNIDSICRETFPRPYDAGELQALAGKTLYFLGSKGYPFAKLSIDIADTLCAADPLKKYGLHKDITVTFIVSENGCYAFAQPLTTGNIKTNAGLLRHDISIKKGQPFNITKIQETKNRLLSRKYIASAETGSLKIIREETSEFPSDTNKPAYKGKVMVPLIISDNTGLGVDGAIAFQTSQTNGNNLTGVFNISLLNMFHHGEIGNLTYKGEENYQYLNVTLGAPYLFGVSLFGTAGFGLEIKQDDYGYLHGELRFTTDLWPYWQWGLELKGHEATTYVDSVPVDRQFAGLDFVMSRETKPYRAGELSKEAEFKIGSGVTQYNGAELTRWHIDLTAGLHYPLNFRHAIVARLVSGAILTDAIDTLQTTELYRTGGYKSIRGYTDNEFAFSSVIFGQAEYHYYFNYSGSVYIFMDGGIGRLNKSSDETSKVLQKMCGYGIGIRIPVKIGDAAIEWARNYRETQSWGRIHVSIRNAVSASASN
jgi:hypothetical protein